ncbi:mitotic interactor and substrate of PLK1 [Orycteropus afer afer]|uniref:Mitotic interactor and substrate of PLK1 n=1 Tax=Orycteropus afer afer TaxID=1230840 RepID=A0A8B7AYT5_ORYAF|nr:mitotic interactor and substrate of PLK1 [Orycteropus afer afer]
MDRVTRYPIFSIPDSPRANSLAPDGDISYTFQLVGVGPEVTSWGQHEPPAWPADHEVRLDTGRSTAPHSLRVSPRKLIPRPLYIEDEDVEMEAHHVDDARDVPRRPRDLEQERRAVIRGQAVRKSSTVATLRDAPRQVDWAPSRALTESLEDHAVDTEQTHFLSARQQFLSLERANAGAPRKPPARVASPPEVGQVPEAFNGPQLANGHGVPARPQVKDVLIKEKKARHPPAGFGVHTGDEPALRPHAGSPEPTKETPIEREIRLAQEREADLREQRGLQRVAGHQELVEIPARPLLTKVSVTAAPRRERGRPSLYVQRDLEQDTQREQDHRRQGGRASTPSWVCEVPQPALRRALSSDSILNLAPDAQVAGSTPEMRRTRRVNRIPPDAYQPFLKPGTPLPGYSTFKMPTKPRGLSAEEVKSVAPPQLIGPQRPVSDSSGKHLGAKQQPLKLPQGPPRADGGIVRREYFLLRPLQFRVPDVPRQAEAPQVWGWEVAGGPALRLQKSQSSELLEQEVESVLRREREVAEERRNALFPEVFSPPPCDSCSPDSRSSSRASGISGSYCVSESPFFTPIHLHSGLVWTVEAEPGPLETPPEDAPWQRKKRDLWYAGINPADHVNSEVLEATRVTRHKNAMAERWEARIYASEDED